jgi:DNA polymerase
MTNDDPRSELAQVAASLRAYLEWQADTGAVGIPRGKRPVKSVPPPQAAAPSPIVSHASPAAAPRETEPVATFTAPPAAFAPPPPAPPPPAQSPPTIAEAPAPTLARLPILAAEVAACTKCGLAKTRTQTVFARGNPSAALCFIGEAPGADEDAQGLPFVGRAGQLLDRMIAAMGLDPAKDVYVANIVKCRPPDNRKPEADEMNACFPYLHEQLAIVRPKVIVAMGNTAVGALLNTKLGITKVRGSWKLYKGTTLVMPTYHPSYLLRPSAQQVEAKKQAWEDLQAVMKELKLPMPAKKT